MSTEKRQVEGLRVAMEMERRGRGVYVRAKQFTQDPALLTLLDELIADETRHYAQFSTMLENLGLPPLGEEEQMLAAAQAATFFFPGGLMEAAMDGALDSAEAMLEKAMESERDSIAFYGQLLAHIDSLDTQEVVVRILREEMNHLRTLMERRENIRKGETTT